MGQKLSAKKSGRKPTVPYHFRKFTRSKYPRPITFRNLGIKDAERRIVTKVKAIPVSATNIKTRRKRCHLKQLNWVIGQISKLKSHPFFRTKENTYDTLDDDHDEYEIEITEQNWNRNIHTHLAIYALVINAANIFRFPHDCYRYGGVVFFAAYAFVTIFIIQPIIYLEMVVGQFSQKGVSGFGDLHPLARGIPQAIVFMSLVFVPFKSVSGYTAKYVYGSVYNNAGNCQQSWNEAKGCVSYDEIQRFSASPTLSSKEIWLETSTMRTSLISSELYFREFILNRRWDGTESQIHGGWNPILYIGFAVTYFLIFVSIRVRLTSIPSKILITIAGLLPLLLVGILASQIFRAGALAGIAKLYFFQIPQWKNLLTLQFWSQVFRSSFVTTGIGAGLYSRVSSKNPFNKDSLHRTSWIVIVMTLTMSLVTTLILMAELGALGHVFRSGTYDTIFTEDTGAGFSAISGALLMLESRAAIFIFFAACNICGIWNEIVDAENCTSQVVTWFSITTANLQIARYVALVIVILLQAICALLVCRTGGLMLDSFLYDGAWPAAFVSLAEVVCIAYIYGYQFFMIDIELMLRHSAPALFKFQLRYSSPVAIFAMFGVMSYTNIRFGDDLYIGVVQKPTFLLVVGFVINAVPPILIIVFAGFRFFKKPEKGLFWFPAIGYLQKMFHRFTHRRAAVFEAHEAEIIDYTADLLRKERQKDRIRTLHQLREDLARIRISKRAKAHWLRFTNKALASRGKLDSFGSVSNWILRELALKKNRKEVKYIRKVLLTYSMECIFTVPKLAVKKRDSVRDKERERLADILLHSIPLDELGFRYAKLTLYERLIGKGQPSTELDKAFMIMRIKEHLGLASWKDEVKWIRLAKESEENRKKNSVFQENPPVEFFFEHEASKIRVIMFDGKDHSILRSTFQPRPPVIEVAQRHIRQRVGLALWKYLKNLVIQEIRKRNVNPPKKLPPAKGKNTGPMTEDLEMEAPPTKRQQLFTPLENWYHNCDIRPYKITALNTFFIAILDRKALKELIKNRFALILPPEMTTPTKTNEVVVYNAPGVYEATYASLYPFMDKISREEERLLRKPSEDFLKMSRKVSPESIFPSKSPDLRFGRPLQEGQGPLKSLRELRRRYSEVDIHLLRRRNPVLDSAYFPEKRYSDSLITEAKRKAMDLVALDLGGTADQRLYSDTFESNILSRKGRRVLEVVESDDDWIDIELIKTRWKTSDVELSRTKSELYSEKAMAAWLSEVKGKTRGGLNEEDGFYYRHKGRKLTVEHRQGRKETSTSDTTVQKQKAPANKS